MTTFARLGHTSAQTWQTVLQARQRSPSRLADSQRTPFLAMQLSREGMAFSGMAASWAWPTTSSAKAAASAMPSTTVAGPRNTSPAV